MFQHIVSHSNQCIFLTVHYTILAVHCQTVNIRIYNECYIRFAPFHQVHDVTEVLFKRFGVVLEIAGRFTVEFFYMFHTQTFKKFRENDTAYRVHTVNRYTEIGFLDSFYIYQVESQYTVDMFLIISQVFAIRAQVVYIGIVEFLSLSNTKYFIAFGCIQKFTMFIQQFQCVPLFRVMRSCQDNTATGAFHCYSKFCGRGRSKINVYYIPAHSHQCADYYVFYHFTGNAGITSHNNLITLCLAGSTNQSSISRGEFYNVKRVQSFSRSSADSSADSRDRFD